MRCCQWVRVLKNHFTRIRAKINCTKPATGNIWRPENLLKRKIKSTHTMICTGMKRICVLLAFLSLYICSKAQTPIRPGELPRQLRPFINQITYQSLGDSRPVIQYESVSKKMWKVSLVWILKDSVRQ